MASGVVIVQCIIIPAFTDNARDRYVTIKFIIGKVLLCESIYTRDSVAYGVRDRTSNFYGSSSSVPYSSMPAHIK